MRVALLHLSDIHFVDGENPVASRAEKIKKAFQALGEKYDACVVAVTGDIAFSGKPSEYEIAFRFFSELREGLHSIEPGVPLEFVFVPGNHDCDFGGVSEVRQLLIGQMPSHLPALNPAGDLVR